MDVSTELLEDHPILALRATETDTTLGVHRGAILAYRCAKCGCADEDVFEIVHDEDCPLSGETAPTAYENRLDDYASGEA